MIWYVATPYTKYPAGLEMAFVDAARATARLMQRGLAVYSPIAHTHPLARFGDIDPKDHAIWLPLDQHMMNAAHGCIVLRMPGWDESYGVKFETEYFVKAGKPIRHFTWPDLSELAEIEQTKGSELQC